MTTSLRYCLIIILVLNILSCGTMAVKPNMAVKRNEVGFIERSISPDAPKSEKIMLLDQKDGQFIMIVFLEYLGTTLKGEIQGFRSDCIRNKGYAEFWNITFYNASQSPIELTEWEYHSGFKLANSKSPDKPINKRMGPEGIRNLLGAHVIPVKGSLVQKNSFMCSETNTLATMEKWVTLKHEGKMYRIVIRQNFDNPQ